MNRRVSLLLVVAILGQAVAFSAIADKQRYAERSLIVNVNTATISELLALPEIGPELAIEIVKNRPYKRVESLLRVKGIDECTLGSIVPYIKLDGSTELYKPEHLGKLFLGAPPR